MHEKPVNCRQTPSYRNQALILYQGPKEESRRAEEEENDDDLGKVSYYYPLIQPNPALDNGSSGMEEEESELSYGEQLRQTGMLGVPPPPMGDNPWEL